MTLALGMVRPGSTLVIPFNTFDSNDPSASVAIAAFIAGDIEIYKDGSVTQRASDSGYTLLDTDGIDFDTHVGIGGFSIDLADNSTAGFYVAGSKYFIVVGPTTVDAGVVNFVAATFEIGMPDAIWNTGITSLTSATQFILDKGPAEASVLIGSPVYLHDVASEVQFAFGVVKTYAVTTKEVVLEATPVGFTPTAADSVSFFMPTDLHSVKGTVQTALVIDDILTDTGTTIPDILKGLVPVNGTIGATGNTTTKLHLVGLTYGNDEINGWTLLVFDNSTSEYHQCLVTDWVLSSALATVEVSDGQVLPFTPEASVDKYWLVTPSTTNNIMDRVLSGATHNVAASLGRRIRNLQDFGLYEGGAVWLDTNNGVSGTTDFENGTVNNPSNSLANARIIADSVGLKIIHVLPASVISLGESFADFELIGFDYTLALNSQSVDNCLIKGSSAITGIFTGTPRIVNSMVGSITGPSASMHQVGLTGTITVNAAGDWFIHHSYSGVAGISTPLFDFGSGVGTTNLNMRAYSGGIDLRNMGQTITDKGSIEGFGQVILNANCTGGILAIRGNFTLTDNSSTTTIVDDARIDTAQINAEVDSALSDYAGPTKTEMDDAHALLATDSSIIALLEDVGLILNRTTIATLASQTSFTLTAGSVDDTAYLDCIAVIEDASTAVQKSVGIVQTYTGGSKTVVLRADNVSGFTIAVGDTITILPSSSLIPSAIRPLTFLTGAITAEVMAANAIGASELADDAVNKIADQVWNEDIETAHGTDATAGLLLRVLGAAISNRSNNPTLNAMLGVADSAGVDIPEQVWSESARILTASTNFNDLSAAQVNAEVDSALDTAIPGSPTSGSINEAVKRLARSVAVVQEYTVDHTSFTATTTAAQVDAVDIGSLEATNDHFIGRIMIFISGALIYQATDITDYDGANKRFTYTALTEAPADDDKFIVV